ncbi:MAG: tetratricopeptide repeat protein [Planctomycetia bacterium]|nr:tetratricopeptide repeat protein [Planctomycetia bacterium]
MNSAEARTGGAGATSEPVQPTDFARRGVERQQQGNLMGALADYTQALALQPDYPVVLNNRGVVRHQLGEFAAAIADFDAALRLRPNYAEAHNNRGSSRQALGDLDGALADFNTAIGLNPRYAEAFDNRAELHSLRWEHAAAAADYDTALALYGALPPESPLYCRLHLHRGDARYHLGEPNALLADYRLAFAGNTELAARVVVERLAQDLRANSRLVLANCLEHQRRNPNDFVAWSRRSLVWLLLGQDGEAQADAEQFYRVSPRNPSPLHEALTAQARLYRERQGVIIPNEPRPSDG